MEQERFLIKTSLRKVETDYATYAGRLNMTNTYKPDDCEEKKCLEELRCIRCCLERILRVMDEGLFVDYQMEKFGKDYKTKEREEK